MPKRKPEMSWDIDDATLDEVGAEIERTINRLHKLQVLYSALQEEDHARVKKLIDEYNRLKREETKDATGDTVRPSVDLSGHAGGESRQAGSAA